MKHFSIGFLAAGILAATSLGAQTITDHQIQMEIERVTEQGLTIREAEHAFQSAVISTAYGSGDEGAVAAIQDRFNVGPEKAAELLQGSIGYFEAEAVRQGHIASAAEGARIGTEAGVTVVGFAAAIYIGGASAIAGDSLPLIISGTGAATLAFAFKTAALIKETADWAKGETPPEPSEGVSTLNDFSSAFAAMAVTTDVIGIDTVGKAINTGIAVYLHPDLKKAAEQWVTLAGSISEQDSEPRETETDWVSWDLAKPDFPARSQSFEYATPDWARQVTLQVNHGYDDTGDHCASVVIASDMGNVSGEACSRNNDEFVVAIGGTGVVVVTISDTDTEADNDYPGNGGELRLRFNSEFDD